jgi:hypothetical protein
LTHRFSAVLAIALAMAPSLVHADDGDKPKKEKKDKKDKKKGKLDDKLSFGGRVFSRAQLTRSGDDGPFRAQGAIASARVGASYKWEALRADIEFETVSRKLKDAFVRLRVLDTATTIDVRAGQFKMPVSAIQLESAWTLPVAERGLINNVLTDRLQVAGRHMGAEVSAKLGGALKPKLIAGVFQGVNDIGDPLSAPASDSFGQDVVARGSIEPIDGLEIGAAGGVRSGQLIGAPFVVRHRSSVELDATLDIAAGPGRARVWAEVLAGTSWLPGPRAGETGHTNATFAGGRVLAAYRFGGAEHGTCFVEPYAMVGSIDPDRAFGDDLVTEATGGVAYGSWDVWRVQAELEVWRIGERSPRSILDTTGADPANTTSFLLQLGAHF